MLLTKVEIKNLKSLNHFVWELTENDSLTGWHVLLGDNGSGKSTFLRACALAIMGPQQAMGLRLYWKQWVRQGSNEAKISINFTQSEIDQWSGKGKTTSDKLRATVKISEDGITSTEITPSPNRHIWGGGSGWCAFSFGPYRRFTGGNQVHEKTFYQMPRLASHLSLFGEDVALTEIISWLIYLDHNKLNDQRKGKKSLSGDLLSKIKEFVNQEGFLPNGETLQEVTPEGVIFRDINGALVDINNLSDGFRSVLSMTLELIRQLCQKSGTDKIFSDKNKKIVVPGVVIIDEIDVQLHPRWQRLIGPWLTEHFPNIQFIVTTHSPLVCQGAITGSITRLSLPGTNGIAERITGVALDRLLYDDIVEAISSGAFGVGIERSEKAQEMFYELAYLNVRSRSGELNNSERDKRSKLQAIFGSMIETLDTK
ncbi:AAA family ATPase [Pantoea sp. CTOTU50773]|uniref:AAA family ATPase n=1 Tax=Pantoea sp. CTOTU50773 TaxID=2953853 RepID=UPI0028A8E408|nr:AAA family ATPase [Pantoea sp. CTOTU50773]